MQSYLPLLALYLYLHLHRHNRKNHLLLPLKHDRLQIERRQRIKPPVDNEQVLGVRAPPTHNRCTVSPQLLPPPSLRNNAPLCDPRDVVLPPRKARQGRKEVKDTPNPMRRAQYQNNELKESHVADVHVEVEFLLPDPVVALHHVPAARQLRNPERPHGQVLEPGVEVVPQNRARFKGEHPKKELPVLG